MEQLWEIARKQERLIIGTMSGTSSDGLDVVLVRIQGSRLATKFEVLAFDSYPYTGEILNRIFAVYPPNRFTGEEIARLSFDLAEVQADSINHFITKSGYRQDEIDLICMYGLTLYHGSRNPEKGIGGAHMEIVEPAVIMERTGITTIADVRPQDVAAGGEGCPFSPYADWIMYRTEDTGRAVQNIGGIANVTGIPPLATLDDLIAFDSGPGNMVIDGLVKIFTNGEEKYDRNGEMAARGVVREDLLRELLDLPYIRREPPKSSGREDFGDQFCAWLVDKANGRGISPEDLVATATAFTAEAIADSYRRFLLPKFDIQEVIVGGGGIHNATLMRMIEEKLAPARVCTHEDFGINSDAKEAITWAILGNEIIQGKTANVPTATGARRPVLLGKILPGHRCLVAD